MWRVDLIERRVSGQFSCICCEKRIGESGCEEIGRAKR